ncbi:hypothetical protein [uncultured Prevotella sp.]|mgnify:CR=1 FL=1|jgi:hypothetical protein|uniref:hypothetical protein n=1 Tax=uncultured Prevotella sp. TaxID=159272 RepID=UPI00261DAFD4|nr:hypothetical protein [uncultured Prevotella sp.]
MNAKSFFMLVREMRQAQKDYFRLRSHEALTKSMALERKVDTEIHRVEDIKGLDSL